MAISNAEIIKHAIMDLVDAAIAEGTSYVQYSAIRDAVAQDLGIPRERLSLDVHTMLFLFDIKGSGTATVDVAQFINDEEKEVPPVLPDSDLAYKLVSYRVDQSK